MRYILDAEYEKVVKAIESFLRWKKLNYKIKTYERPKMTKFGLGFAKSVVVASVRSKVYVKAPAELADVIAEFTTTASFGKMKDRVEFELELEQLECRIEAAKKVFLLICGLTLIATPVFILREQLIYSLLLLAFTLIPLKQNIEGLEFYTFPALYPYYVFRIRRLKKKLER